MEELLVLLVLLDGARKRALAAEQARDAQRIRTLELCDDLDEMGFEFDRALEWIDEASVVLERVMTLLFISKFGPYVDEAVKIERLISMKPRPADSCDHGVDVGPSSTSSVCDMEASIERGIEDIKAGRVRKLDLNELDDDDGT